MLVPYGKTTKYGYFGRIECGKWQLFATEGEYLDYVEEYNALVTG